jgi:hypothetical protein
MYLHIAWMKGIAGDNCILFSFLCFSLNDPKDIPVDNAWMSFVNKPLVTSTKIQAIGAFNSMDYQQTLEEFNL